MVYPLRSFLKKNLASAHGIDQRGELKKKNRTTKDTENIKYLIL